MFSKSRLSSSKCNFVDGNVFKILCSGQTFERLFFFTDFSIQWVKAEKTYLEAKTAVTRHVRHMLQLTGGIDWASLDL